MPWRSADELEEIETYRAHEAHAEDPDGLLYASESMEISDDAAIHAARKLIQDGVTRDPYEALERAVIALGESTKPEKRKRKAVRAMTPDQFKAARHKLGLSVTQMALMLGIEESGTQVRRMEMQPGKSTHRPVSGTTARLVKAYLDGYRPRDWVGE